MAYALHARNGTFYTYRGRQVDAPARGAQDIDLSAYDLYPGLVNAHDHLELNHYPRTKYQERYNNAHQWGDEVNERLNDEPFVTLQRYSLWDRCFIGGLKNLLSGVTTVAHHGPLHNPLISTWFPIRVLQTFGWAHSLHFETEIQIHTSYTATPPDNPWFIHLAEGTDDVAAGEYKRLNELGCIGPNTVIVHGVGLRANDLDHAKDHIRGIVRCPTTNHYLLGRTLNDWPDGLTVGLGSDSRLTADGDFLSEPGATDPTFQNANRKILGIETERHADFYAAAAPPRHRTDIALVMVSGQPVWGANTVIERFKHVQTISGDLDGHPIALAKRLARQISRCKIDEPGLRLDR
ncbi:MAG: hypothetical protein AAF125_02935, partial [Chloroflexota bacterium]